MSPTSPFTAPVGIDFSPSSAITASDTPTLFYLLEKLIEEERSFFCQRTWPLWRNEWTVFVSAPRASQPKETPVDTPDHVR